MSDSDVARPFADDARYLPEIKAHSLEKIALHNRIAGIVAVAMRPQCTYLGYVGLYSGAGAARVAGSARIVETSALAVQRSTHPFTHYVYVDEDPKCIEALRARIAVLSTASRSNFIVGDVNEKATEVLAAIPTHRRGERDLSFCFVDPFDLSLRFETIRALSSRRMDMLVLLMLGVDGRRNFKPYFADSQSTRIGDFLGVPDWREAFVQRPGARRPVRFLLERFDDQMVSLGYLSARQDAHAVFVPGKGVLLYILAYYSHHQLGQKLWREARRTLTAQPELGLL